MVTSRKWLYDIEELAGLRAELFHGTTTMISVNGIMLTAATVGVATGDRSDGREVAAIGATPRNVTVL